MRPLLLSLGTFCLVLGATWAQNSTDGGTGPQLPVGQIFKQFVYPYYQDGKLKATLDAVEAKGITLNRAETTDLKIQVYDNGTVTTTITSPKADLYVNEQKMRTKNTVLIVRDDMTAASQDCDFDLKTKKYVLRDKVKVVLKHFDLSLTPGAATPNASAPAPANTPPAPAAPRPARSDDSLLTSPGSYADTNSAPTPPSSPETK
jgi:hypothetical protein